MIDKSIGSVAEAVSDIHDGATVMIGGFGEAGSPIELIHALIDLGARELTVVNNNTGNGQVGLAALIVAGSVAMGFVPHWIHQGTLWFTSSLGLIVALRRAATASV